MTVMAFARYRNNAELMLACRELGYLRDEWRTLDPTWGRGTFWKLWQPSELVCHDLNTLDGVDFRRLPHGAGSFDSVVFDPPYKLNGTATPEVDQRYGVHTYASPDARHELIEDGLDECARVLRRKGTLLVKCQDQVVSGAVRWQTREFSDYVESGDCRLIDALHFESYRPQPAGRRQVHARRNYSTLLIFRKVMP